MAVLLLAFGTAQRNPASAAAPDAAAKPNVLFIAIDDLNDWTGVLGGHPQAATPHLDALAARSVLFTQAHCAAPACNPSRAALMTGIRPSTSGVYTNSQPWRPAMPDAVTMPQHFMKQGYRVVGGGKIYHGRYKDPQSWQVYYDRPADPAPAKLPANGIAGTGHFDWGPVAETKQQMGDWQVADWAIEQISRKHDQPFFIAAGIFRPHLPWYVPQEYFDRFPLDEIQLPKVNDQDLDDVPPAGVKMARPQGDHKKVVESNNWKRAVQGYLASMSFADDCVGRILDALAKSPQRDNTIVVLWSDHGWHLGEKHHWRKFALWDEATRVTMMITAPGVSKNGSQCRRPVNLIDIYPTLNELCGLPQREELEGTSLLPLLKDPDATWDRPTLTTHGRNNHAVRSEQYRYIRYQDGSEELYDHKQDPLEWNNLAGRPELADLKQQLARWLPKENVANAPTDRAEGKTKTKVQPQKVKSKQKNPPPPQTAQPRVSADQASATPATEASLPTGLHVLDDRLKLTLIAENPQVVTPIGIACDERGRLFVCESHTHFRPDGYSGPELDRVRLLEDRDGDGEFESVSNFATDIKLAMGIALESPTRAYVITRSELLLLEDQDDDGTADRRTVLARLDTPGNYPHNGLSGVTQAADGQLYFSLGENLGEPYRLIGSDGTTISGGGEGGSIYRCQPDGTKLARMATGFWNTFGLGFDVWGNLFAVDNDPDSRPPCRLLHVVKGGDYGYRFRYGRKGTHPYIAWNGELPGTLPMVCGTGEAPCAVMAYESTGLPRDYRGRLLVTSWSDHRLDLITLTPQGGSFSQRTQAVLQGDDNFRPVCLCTGPDGAVYFTDWVLKSYPLHSRGRVWKLQGKQAGKQPRKSDASVAATADADRDELLLLLRESGRIEVRRAAARRLVELDSRLPADIFKTPRAAAEVFAALKRRGRPIPADLSQLPLSDEAAPLVALLVRSSQPELAEQLAGRWSRLPHAVRLAVLEQVGDSHGELALKVIRNQSAQAEQDRSLPLDPFLLHGAVQLLARSQSAEELASLQNDPDAHVVLASLLAWRLRDEPRPAGVIGRYLNSNDPQVARAAVQWVGEAALEPLADKLEAVLERNPTREVFLAYIAARELLAGKRKTGREPFDTEQPALDIFRDQSRPAELRQVALRMLPADRKDIQPDELIRALESHGDAQASTTDGLAREAVWLLRDAPRDQALPALLAIAQDRSRSGELRADTLETVRSYADSHPQARKLLEQLAATPDDPLAAQAARLLEPPVQGGDPSEARASLDTWKQRLLAGGSPAGNADRGRRVFYRRGGVGCYQCHTIDGRGGPAGPELSQLTRQLTPDRLLESIVEPSREIAPLFVNWTVLTNDGRQLTGVLLRRNSQNNLTLADAQGRVHQVSGKDVDELLPSKKSLMPDGLPERMTEQEFRDLLAFLRSLQ